MSNAQVTMERQGAVSVVTLDRQERQNALDDTMLESLEGVVEQLEAAPPRVVVVTGAGDAFCAGLDLSAATNPAVGELLRAVNDQDRTAVDRLLGHARGVVDRLVGLPVPVIAAVNGVAWGAGAELALRCDLRVLDGTATLCLVGARMGLAPMLGGGPALVHLVGPARAADLVLTARKVSAMEAFGLGLVNRLCEPGQALASAVSLALSISRNGPRAVRAALEVVRSSPGLVLEQAHRLERDLATDLVLSGEFLVGIRAAMAKTEPDYSEVG